MAVVTPAANASQTDQPLLFSTEHGTTRLNDLGPGGRVAEAATSLVPVFGLLAPFSPVSAALPR
ncbi:hypothetical protein AB0C96_38045 [Streptomyces sp. NPDC048506]|uniref:hypothetical protein n=1 Tax=Streptomyces sp. NPDC048506 TaxID=3155028 RepID=UPI0034474079